MKNGPNPFWKRALHNIFIIIFNVYLYLLSMLSLSTGGGTVWAMWASGPPTFSTVWAWPTHFLRSFFFFFLLVTTPVLNIKIVPPPLSLRLEHSL